MAIHLQIAQLCIAMTCAWFWSTVLSRTLVLENLCRHTVWPGIQTGAGTPPLTDSKDTGFELVSGSQRRVEVSEKWSGRVWARTGCGGGATNFSCETADCGTREVVCSGNGAAPPATLVEMTLEGSDGKDFYDISLVDGFNLGASIVPSNQSCQQVDCSADISQSCPSELSVMGGYDGNGQQVVACKSACLAFQKPDYCCSGNYSSPSACKPSSFSLFFKAKCPTAYSYAFDDATSTFTCPASPSLLYNIIFCPPSSSSSSSSSYSRIDRRMVVSSYIGFLLLVHNLL